ncbi:MAG: phosphoribosylformylglycinamidine synthase I [Candidatus Omnitrophota bacterium]
MPKKVKVVVLRTAGTNCDQETVFAFQSVGADVDLVHINKFFKGEKRLKDYQILALPGGFTYGDDIAAGRILANELRLKLGDDLRAFIQEGKLIIGICNGFQVMVKAGLLPGTMNGQRNSGRDFAQRATLMINDSGKFEDRWVHLKPAGHCVWTEGMEEPVSFPVAHGEGKFVCQDAKTLKSLKDDGQVIFRYCDPLGGDPVYPENPNGSVDHIAGITDSTGRVFGLMPHPERHFLSTQHPAWTRLKKKTRFGDGARIFHNGVDYVKKNLL